MANLLDSTSLSQSKIEKKIEEMSECAAREFKNDARSGVDEAIKTAFYIAQKISFANALLVPLHHLINELAGLDRGLPSKLFVARPIASRPRLSIDEAKYRVYVVLYIESLILSGSKAGDACITAANDIGIKPTQCRNWRQKMKSPNNGEYRPSRSTWTAGKYFDDVMTNHRPDMARDAFRKGLLRCIQAMRPKRSKRSK